MTTTGLIQAIARGHPIDAVLDDIGAAVEARFGGRCLVGVLGPEGRIIPVVGRLRADDVAAFDRPGLTEPPSAGSIGVVADPPAWVVPITGADPNRVLGSLVLLRPGDGPPDPNQQAELGHWEALASIVLDRDHLERRLQRRSLYDDLTGLPNRYLLLGRAGTALGRRPAGSVAVLYISLDRFAVLNDRFGEAVGDELLHELGQRFRRAVHPGDTVARIGGDRFVVLCEGVAGEKDVVAVADHLAAVLAQPAAVAGQDVFLTASMGLARSEPDDTADTLMQHGEQAAGQAKERGRDQLVVYRTGERSWATDRIDLQSALHQALTDGRIDVHYQPQVRVADGALCGVEALARWALPGRGLVPPDEFVPVAADSGLIVPLGELVLDRAVAAASAWPDGPAGPLRVTVNLAARQLLRPDIVDRVATVLDRHRLPAERLCLEVTESDLARDTDGAAEVMARLADLGVRLAIDDFGTGYATLDHVRRFSVADILKIDATFVAGLDDPASSDRAIVAATVTLARALGFETVAEGVETPGQLEVLRELGCDQAQGYLLGRPVPAEELPGLHTTPRLQPEPDHLP